MSTLPRPAWRFHTTQDGIALPLTAPINPLAAAVGRHSLTWGETTGLITDEADRRQHSECAPHLAAARMYPHASAAHLALISDYLTWFFALDDRVDWHGMANRSFTKLFTDLGAVRRNGPIPEATGAPLLTALLDLCQRTNALASPSWLRRFNTHLDDIFTAFGVEISQRTNTHPPTETAYVGNRRRTSCCWVFADFTELASGLELTPMVCDSLEYHVLLDAAADIGAWDNDVVSLRREQARGDASNLILLLTRTRQVSVNQAKALVTQWISRRISDYLRAEEQLLTLLESVPMTSTVHRQHSNFVLALRDNLGGVLNWNHCDTRRFTTLDEQG